MVWSPQRKWGKRLEPCTPCLDPDEVISNGTPRMPGFKYHFEPTQIEAIVAFRKTIPTPPTPAPAATAR